MQAATSDTLMCTVFKVNFVGDEPVDEILRIADNLLLPRDIAAIGITIKDINRIVLVLLGCCFV